MLTAARETVATDLSPPQPHMKPRAGAVFLFLLLLFLAAGRPPAAPHRVVVAFMARLPPLGAAGAGQARARDWFSVLARLVWIGSTTTGSCERLKKSEYYMVKRDGALVFNHFLGGGIQLI
jgi:hypothetical protein